MKISTEEIYTEEEWTRYEKELNEVLDREAEFARKLDKPRKKQRIPSFFAIKFYSLKKRYLRYFQKIKHLLKK